MDTPVLLKEIRITIPNNKNLPDEIHQFSADENYIMLKIGSDCLMEGKRGLMNISHTEISNKLQDTFKKETEKIELELVVAREMMKNYRAEEGVRLETEANKILKYKLESYEKLYSAKDKDIKNLNDVLITREKELIQIKENMRSKELDTNNFIDKKVNEQLKQERERHTELMKDTLSKNTLLLENISVNSGTKTSSEIGTIGEKAFADIAEKTFIDFEGFELLDVHKQPHKGDYHLVFKDLTIMIDAKLYKKKVDSTQRDKIKNDMKNNQQIHFAWLVSLNTKIDKFDNAPFLFEWISNDQCIVYINQLMSVEDQSGLLKAIYFICRDNFNRIINTETDSHEITKMRENQFALKDKIDVLKKRVKEMKVAMNGIKNIHDLIENDLVNLLNIESNSVVNKYYELIVQWWSHNITTEPNAKLKSTTIWSKFKKDNEEIVKDLDANTFKDILCLFVPENDITKTKGKGGALEIDNVKMNEHCVITVKTAL